MNKFTNNAVVRKMEIATINTAVDLFIDTFSKEPWNDEYESREQVVEFFKNHFANNYFLGYELVIDGILQGLCIGMKKPWIKGMEYYIDEFCVSHSSQNKGLGTLFINMIEDDINQHGLNGIIRSEERRVGKECTSWGRSGGSAAH